MRRPTIWLLVVNPRNPATGATVTVRMAGGGQAAFKQLGQSNWWAGLEGPPSIVQRLGFDDGAFGDGAVVQALELVWGGPVKRIGILAAYYWRDAAFTLYKGPEGGTDGEYAVVLAGRIAEALPEPERITLQMADPSVDLARPVLAGASFAGTGGIEGVAELKGRPKRRAVGQCRNVELWALDPANNIWVATDPAKPLQAFDQVYDKGNAASALTVIAWAGSIAATLAALAAAACPQGGAAVAPSIACIKWWFANPGKLTCDLRGEIGAAYIDRPADIAAWCVAAVNGPPVNAASLAAARALRNIEAGLLVADDAGAGALITDLLAGVSLWWGMMAAGEMEFGAWAFGASGGTIVATRAARIKTHKPVKKLTLGWRPNHLVMGRGDIAASLLIGDVPGAIEVSHDTVPPLEMAINSIYIASDRRQYLFVGRDLLVNGGPLLVGGSPLKVSGYIDIQDDGIAAAQVAAATAATTAAAANVDLANIASDALLTPNEKPRVILDVDTINAEQAGIDAQATAYGVTTEKTAYDAAVAALSAYLAGLTAPAFWSNLAGNTAIVGATFRAKFGDVYAARQALLNKISDKLKTVEPGADVTANSKVSVELPNAEKRVAADYTGAVVAGNLAALVWSPRVTKGGLAKKVDDLTSYALSETFGGSFSVSNATGATDKGDILISAISANKAGGNLTITHAGVAEPKIAFSVTKDIAAPPPSSSSTPAMVMWESGEFTGINVTSYAPISTVKTLALVSGQSLYGTASLDYYISGFNNAARTMTLKFQYGAAGSGVWNDFAAGVTGTVGYAGSNGGYPDYEYSDAEPGSVSLAQTKSGLSAGNYDVRLVGICSATGRTCTPVGTANVIAKI